MEQSGQDKDEIEVTLLIGVNCVKALEPCELIASKNGVHIHSQQFWDSAL